MKTITSVSNAVGRYGPNPKEVERFLKFAVVGVIGAVIDFGSFNILRTPFSNLAEAGVFDSLAGLFNVESISIAVGIVTGISFVLAVISNFIWNRYWTYPESRSKSKRLQMTQFAAVNAAGFFVRPPIFAFTHLWFGAVLLNVIPTLSEETAYWLGDNICLAMIVGVVMLWNFFVNRYWTYGDVDSQDKNQVDGQEPLKELEKQKLEKA
ncbi:MAG: GtrA family protein [Chloroflexota bacterium]